MDLQAVCRYGMDLAGSGWESMQDSYARPKGLRVA
jgi:hypothetical protein